MKEKDLQVIEIKGISADIMKILLDCIYTENVNFTVENVQEILAGAALLQLTDIRLGCEDFLKNQLDPQNCLGIKKFAELHNCQSLKVTTDDYINENFCRIVQNSEEFFTLEPKEIEDLIKSNEIEVLNEEIVYKCIFAWINHDKLKREKYLPNLIMHIKLPLLSPQFLTDVCDREEMIKKSHLCRDMLDEAKKYYLRPDCRSEMSGSRFNIRAGKDEHLVMLGGFGFQQKPLDVVEMYSPRTDSWTSLQPLLKKRRYAAAASIGKCIYIIGGYDTKVRLKSVEKLDLSEPNPQWQSVSSLLFRRGLPAVCVHDSK
jgi:kelch-like protein 12